MFRATPIVLVDYDSVRESLVRFESCGSNFLLPLKRFFQLCGSARQIALYFTPLFSILTASIRSSVSLMIGKPCRSFLSRAMAILVTVDADCAQLRIWFERLQLARPILRCRALNLPVSP